MDSLEQQTALVISSETGEVQNLAPAKIQRSFQPGIVKASVTPQEAAEAMKQYQAICEAVLTAEDYQDIDGKKFKKRSAWQKLATCWNLSVESLSEKEIREPDGSFSFDTVCRAMAPNGRAVTGDGSANSREHSDSDDSRHNVRAKAHTRAFNRAVANLIAAGEVSADEMDQGRKSSDYTRPTQGYVITEETVLRFGTKFKGKKLGEVDRTKLIELLQWMIGKNTEEGKELSGQPKAVWEFLQTPPKQDSEDPGNWDPFNR